MSSSPFKLSDPNTVDVIKSNPSFREKMTPSKLILTPSRITSLQSKDKENQDPSTFLDGTSKNYICSSKKSTSFQHFSPSLKLRTIDSPTPNGHVFKAAIHHRPTPFKLFDSRPVPAVRSNEKENSDSSKSSKFQRKRPSTKKPPTTCKLKLTSLDDQDHDVPSDLFKVVPDTKSFLCNKASTSAGRILPKIYNSEKEEKIEDFCQLQTIDEDDEVLSDQSDGFDICTLQTLDGPSNTPTETDLSQMFEMKSLINNKMMLDCETMSKLMEAEQGSSPALATVPSDKRFQKCLPPLKLRRCTSMVEHSSAMSVKFASEMLPVSEIFDFTSPVSRCSFKRPADPTNDTNQRFKRRKQASEKTCTSLMNCPSMDNIDRACSLTDKPNLTADGSRQLLLPTVLGSTSNRDLNNIDCHAMASLINGHYTHQVASFRIIDARYAYEFKGGHIRGAENFGKWNEDSFKEEFLPETLGSKELEVLSRDSPPSSFDAKRHILIFHCEFSSARGPTLLRHLRKMDRALNASTYPALHYPECYLLHDGYKAFFKNYPHLCEPISYIRMADPRFAKLEKDFRQRSKSWNAGGSSSVSRTKNSMMMRRGKSCEDSVQSPAASTSTSTSSPCMGKRGLFK